jgi:hypothetical protein
MVAKQIALKLILDELGVDHGIRDIEDRKSIQKAIYMGQVVGADLGYNYGWYVKGPYSPQLARDYYDLNFAMETGDEDFKDRHLPPSAREKLKSLKPLLEVPKGCPLRQDDWLEAIASYHFLRTGSRLDDDQATKRMNDEKPHLKDYVALARQKLVEAALLS